MRSGRLWTVLFICAFSLVLPSSPLYAGVSLAHDFYADTLHAQDGRTVAEPRVFGSLAVPRDVEQSGPLSQSQYRPPRYELAVSAVSERRGRWGCSSGMPRAEQDVFSNSDRRTLKEAEQASRTALMHAMRSYDHRFVNDMTEGGKNVVSEVSNHKDWTDAIPSAATD